jgi:hypothetical protein
VKGSIILRPPETRPLTLQPSAGIALHAASRRGGIRLLAAGLLLAWLVQPSPGLAARSAQQPTSDPAVEPAVREALQRYATALESLDADAVKKVQPSIDVDGLKRAFGEMRSLDVDIDNIRVLSGDRAAARVSCRVTQTLTPKAGSRQTSTVTRVLRLRRQDSSWIIQDFER